MKAHDTKANVNKLMTPFGRYTPSFLRNILSHLAVFRAKRCWLYAGMCILFLCCIQVAEYFFHIQDDKLILEGNLQRLADSMANALKMTLQRDTVYQTQVANLWSMYPGISRTDFRNFVMSEAYAPALTTFTGMSLIPLVKKQDRTAFEANPENAALMHDCCNTTRYDLPGKTCKTSMEFLCAHGTYAINQRNGSAAILAPEQEEYTVVHYIEPFEKMLQCKAST